MHVHGFRVARRSAALALVLALSGLPFAFAATEENPPPPATPGAPAEGEVIWEPVTFNYDGNGIDLLEAVRLTIGNDPNLLLRREDMRTAEGRLLEESGAFDWTLTGQLTYEHRVQEIRESARQAEIDRRNQIRDVQVLSCTEEQNLRLELEDLRRAQTTTGVDIRNDAGFEAQVRILEAAILAVSDAAQLAALQETRNNLIATEIAAVSDGVAAANQVCRETGEGLERLGEVPEEERFDLGRANVRLERLTRGGTLLAPFFNASYDDTQFLGKRNGFFAPSLDPFGQPLISPSGIPLERLIDFGGKNVDEVFSLDVGFEVNVPVLRNRGVEATGAFETAAAIDLDASRQLLEHAASESVLNTAFAYWNVVAAQDRVRVLDASVAQQGKMVEITQSLVDASELPGAEMPRSQAGLSNARAQLAAAQRDLATARLDLVRAMGLSVDGEENVPSAATAFPAPPTRDAVEALEPAAVDAALDQRLDLKASHTLIESGQTLAVAAEDALKDRLDATSALWLNARGDQKFSNVFDNVASEPSWRLGANYEHAFGNRSAKGRLQQSESTVRQREISEADLARQIRIGVVRAAAALAEAVDQLREAEAASASFDQTVASEVEKLGLGETTVIDTILTEQQRTGARLQEIAARFRVATLLAQLRFETGTLVETDEAGPRVTPESLTTLPAAQTGT